MTTVDLALGMRISNYTTVYIVRRHESPAADSAAGGPVHALARPKRLGAPPSA